MYLYIPRYGVRKSSVFVPPTLCFFLYYFIFLKNGNTGGSYATPMSLNKASVF